MKNIKLILINKELSFLRMILYLLLHFKKPTDKMVVSCSQQLDEIIIKHYKVTYGNVANRLFKD